MKNSIKTTVAAAALAVLHLATWPAAAQPTLGITNDPAIGPAVSWPVADAGYSLLYTTSLTPTAWQPYPSAPSISGDGSSLLMAISSLQATNPQAFFQLVSNFVAAPAAPTVVTMAPSTTNYTGAELQGTVQPNSLDTTWWFQWGLTASYGNTIGSGVVVGSNTTPQAVYSGITGLSPGTTYHFQLYASNADGTSSGGDLTFTTPAALPDAIVQTYAASNVTSTTALLGGSVNPNGTVLAGFFQWGTTTSYGNNTSPQFYDYSENFQPVNESAGLTGLAPGTTYYYRIVAFNGGPDEALGNEVQFTTSAAFQQPPPIVNVGSASSVSSTCATLNGSVNPNGAAASYYFVYGSGSDISSTATNSAGSGSSAASVQTTVCGLTPNTIYSYYIVAANSGGSAGSGTASFTTGAASQAPPTVQTLAATEITSNGAELNGSVNPNGAPSTTLYFQWGASMSYGSITGLFSYEGAPLSDVQDALTNLMASTTYHCRFVGSNSAGISYGADVTFTTASAVSPPTVVTLAATGVTTTAAQLNGLINPKGADTHYYFTWGSVLGYYNTPLTDAGSNTTDGTFGVPISGLTPGITYLYQIVASNSAGTSSGADVYFNTPPLPPQIISTGAYGYAGGGYAQFIASVNPEGGNTSVYFQYGMTTNYQYNTMPATGIGSGTTAVSVTNSVENNTIQVGIYHYRAVASSPGGTVYSPDQEFVIQNIP